MDKSQRLGPKGSNPDSDWPNTILAKNLGMRRWGSCDPIEDNPALSDDPIFNFERAPIFSLGDKEAAEDLKHTKLDDTDEGLFWIIQFGSLGNLALQKH